MAIVREQFNTFQGGADASPDVTLTSVTAGSLLILVASIYAGSSTGSVVTDNNGNSWNELYDNNYSGEDWGFMAYAMNANAGTTIITLTISGFTQYSSIVAIEVSGIATTSALDQSNDAVTSATTWDSGNITTTQADEYLIGGYAQDSGNYTITPDSAWTSGDGEQIFEEETQSTDMPINVSQRIVSSTLTESFSGTISSSAAGWAAIASFKGIAGGPADLNTSVSDGATVADSPTITPLVLGGVGVSDGATVADSPTVSLQQATPRAINVSDGVAVADVPTVRMTRTINRSDGVTVADTPTVTRQQATTLSISVSDGATVADSPTVRMTRTISQSDGLTVTDSTTITPLLLAGVSASDGVTVADVPTVATTEAGTLTVSVSDGLVVADSPAVSLQAATTLSISASDGATVADAVTVTPLLLAGITSTDSATVADSTTITPLLLDGITSTDVVTVTDVPAVTVTEAGAFSISVSDGVTIADAAGLNLTIDIDSTDGATVADVPVVAVESLIAALEIRITPGVVVS